MCAGKFEWPTISASTILQQIVVNIVQICTITVRSSSEMLLNGQLSFIVGLHVSYIHLTKTTAAQNEVALSYHSVRGLYFLAVVFVRSIILFDTGYDIKYFYYCSIFKETISFRSQIYILRADVH